MIFNDNFFSSVKCLLTWWWLHLPFCLLIRVGKRCSRLPKITAPLLTKHQSLCMRSYSGLDLLAYCVCTNQNTCLNFAKYVVMELFPPETLMGGSDLCSGALVIKTSPSTMNVLLPFSLIVIGISSVVVDVSFVVLHSHRTRPFDSLKFLPLLARIYKVMSHSVYFPVPS